MNPHRRTDLMAKKLIMVEVDEETYTRISYRAWELHKQIPELAAAALAVYADRIPINEDKFAEFDAR